MISSPPLLRKKPGRHRFSSQPASIKIIFKPPPGKKRGEKPRRAPQRRHAKTSFLPLKPAGNGPGAAPDPPAGSKIWQQGLPSLCGLVQENFRAGGPWGAPDLFTMKKTWALGKAFSPLPSSVEPRDPRRAPWVKKGPRGPVGDRFGPGFDAYPRRGPPLGGSGATVCGRVPGPLGPKSVEKRRGPAGPPFCVPRPFPPSPPGPPLEHTGFCAGCCFWLAGRPSGRVGTGFGN